MPVLTISRIDRIERTYTITATNLDGSPATVDSIDFGITAPRARVTAATTWVTFPVTSGEVTVEYAGPDAADKTGTVLLIPAEGAQVHMREVDGRLADAEKVERVVVS